MHDHRGDLPEAARLVVDDLRRLDPPPALLAAVVRQAAETPQRRRGQPFGVARLVGAAALATFAILALALPRLPIPGSGAGTPVVDLRIPVPDGAHTGSADRDSVWLGIEQAGAILRVDARTGEIRGEVRVNEPTDEAYDLWPVSDGRSVWAAGRDDRTLVRLDIASMSVAARWPIDAVPYRVVPAGDTVWVSDFDGGRVLKVDAVAGRVLGAVEVARPTGIAVTPAGVYVVGYVGDLVLIDPATMSATRGLPISGNATDLLPVEGGLLIWGLRGRVLERVDIDVGTVVATKSRVTAVATLEGAPWAALDTGRVARLDPQSLVSTAEVDLGQVRTDQLVASADRLWAYIEAGDGTYLYGIRPAP
jgi:hypothetical protein